MTARVRRTATRRKYGYLHVHAERAIYRAVLRSLAWARGQAIVPRRGTNTNPESGTVRVAVREPLSRKSHFSSDFSRDARFAELSHRPTRAETTGGAHLGNYRNFCAIFFLSDLACIGVGPESTIEASSNFQTFSAIDLIVIRVTLFGCKILGFQFRSYFMTKNTNEK